MNIKHAQIRNIAGDTTKKSIPAKNELHIQASMYPFLKESSSYLECLDAYQAANIIDGVNEWRTLHIKKKNIDQKVESYNPFRYSPRDIVFVRLGSTNIGYEPSYKHPAVILQQGYNWVLIAPCSTGRFGKGIREVVDAYAATDGVKFNTGIQVDKIRVIDKWRIESKLGRLGKTKFEELSNKVLELHFEYHWNKLELNKNEISALRKMNDELSKELQDEKDKFQKYIQKISTYQEEVASTVEMGDSENIG